MEQKYWKKMIAPIVITAIMVIYLLLFVVLGWFTGAPFFIWLIAVLMPLALIGACIYVLIERIEEIRSGEEDDLSKY